jgi:acyl-CoA hydrolase
VAEHATDQRNEDRGEPAVRTLAMPADTNPSGDIFGGWVLAQMDLAAGIVAHQRARSRIVTAALDGMSSTARSTSATWSAATPRSSGSGAPR